MQNYPIYQHRQWALINLLFLLVPVLAIFVGVPSVLRAHGEAPAISLMMRVWPLFTLVILACGVFLSRLEVTVDQEKLSIRFGPGIYRKSWPISDIVHAATTRTTLAAGFGVHRYQQAWIYNVSGFDAVRITFRDGRAIIIGSNDAIRLAHVLERARPRT